MLRHAQYSSSKKSPGLVKPAPDFFQSAQKVAVQKTSVCARLQSLPRRV